MIASTLYSAPMAMGDSTAMLDKSREGRELWRISQMSTHELLCRTFENDRVRLHFARVASETLAAPDEKGTALGIYVLLGFIEAYGFGVPVGGSGALTSALIRCIEEHGGRVVSQFDVASGADARGHGQWACVARMAVSFTPGMRSSLPFTPIISEAWCRGSIATVAADAAATETSAVACITVHAALKEPLRTVRGEPVRSVMLELLPSSYDALRRSFDDLRYRQLSTHPLIGLGSLSAFDDSRVPAGHAVLHAWDYVPYERADGRSWDQAKEEYAKHMVAHMTRFLPNLADSVITWHCDSPLDMERTSSSFVRGDLHGIAMPSYQAGSHRPTPELSQFSVPGIAGLYLVGPFQHPGGGVFGAGRATAQKVCEDLKIDFDKAARVR